MLQLEFDITPDDNQMVDGLELAGRLIDLAVRVINPYVNKCPACLDAVFAHVANHQLERIHLEMKTAELTSATGILYCFADPAVRNDVIREHLADYADTVAAIVENHAEPHRH